MIGLIPAEIGIIAVLATAAIAHAGENGAWIFKPPVLRRFPSRHAGYEIAVGHACENDAPIERTIQQDFVNHVPYVFLRPV